MVKKIVPFFPLPISSTHLGFAFTDIPPIFDTSLGAKFR
jgi:hypothetical protein